MKLSPKKYAQALAMTLEENADPKKIIRNFLELLRKKKQFRLLPKILRAFEEEWSRRRGIVRLKVTYPHKFEATVREFEENLAQKLGRALQMEAKSSQTLLGGLRVQAGDTLIDASLETRLKNLEYHLNS